MSSDERAGLDVTDLERILDQTADVRPQMLTIQALDPSAHIEFSAHTGKWFVSANIEVADGATLTSLSCHEPSPQAAVTAFLYRIQKVDLSDWDHVLVTKRSGQRRHWRWNGAQFTEDMTWPTK